MKERLPVTLLLGAEDCSEMQDELWLRAATKNEVNAVLEGMDEKRRKQVRAMDLDGIGRPYHWMTVLPTAPDWAWRAGASNIRVVRLHQGW